MTVLYEKRPISEHSTSKYNAALFSQSAWPIARYDGDGAVAPRIYVPLCACVVYK